MGTELPEPKLPSLSTKTTIPSTEELAAQPAQRPATPPKPENPPPQPRTMRKASLEFPESDPWRSPALHKGHAHSSSPPKTNGSSAANGAHEPVRTTSGFTTNSTETPSNGSSSITASNPVHTPGAGVWGTYDGESNAPFNNSSGSGLGGQGFGDVGGDGEAPTPIVPSRSFGGGRVTGGGVEEVITVTLLPEKEGMFMFQHHNYQIISQRRGSKVVRRYSDFVWLLDCLQKRYPFRQLPLLPPKRVGGKSHRTF
jgi:sorting nexin-8